MLFRQSELFLKLEYFVENSVKPISDEVNPINIPYFREVYMYNGFRTYKFFEVFYLKLQKIYFTCSERIRHFVSSTYHRLAGVDVDRQLLLISSIFF